MTVLGYKADELVKKLLLGSGVTAGAILTYQLFELAKKDPKLLEQVVNWGPLFVIGVIALTMIDRNFSQMIQVSRENVLAQQQMSAAMEKIADKDDRQSEELRRLTAYSALQTEKMLRQLDDQTRVLNQVAVDQGKQHEQLKRHEYWLAQIGERVKEARTSIDLTVPAEQARGAKA